MQSIRHRYVVVAGLFTFFLSTISAVETQAVDRIVARSVNSFRSPIGSTSEAVRTPRSATYGFKGESVIAAKQTVADRTSENRRSEANLGRVEATTRPTDVLRLKTDLGEHRSTEPAVDRSKDRTYRSDRSADRRASRSSTTPEPAPADASLRRSSVDRRRVDEQRTTTDNN